MKGIKYPKSPNDVILFNIITEHEKRLVELEKMLEKMFDSVFVKTPSHKELDEHSHKIMNKSD